MVLFFQSINSAQMTLDDPGNEDNVKSVCLSRDLHDETMHYLSLQHVQAS